MNDGVTRPDAVRLCQFTTISVSLSLSLSLSVCVCSIGIEGPIPLRRQKGAERKSSIGTQENVNGFVRTMCNRSRREETEAKRRNSLSLERSLSFPSSAVWARTRQYLLGYSRAKNNRLKRRLRPISTKEERLGQGRVGGQERQEREGYMCLSVWRRRSARMKAPQKPLAPVSRTWGGEEDKRGDEKEQGRKDISGQKKEEKGRARARE